MPPLTFTKNSLPTLLKHRPQYFAHNMIFYDIYIVPIHCSCTSSSSSSSGTGAGDSREGLHGGQLDAMTSWRHVVSGIPHHADRR